MGTFLSTNKSSDSDLNTRGGAFQGISGCSVLKTETYKKRTLRFFSLEGRPSIKSSSRLSTRYKE